VRGSERREREMGMEREIGEEGGRGEEESKRERGLREITFEVTDRRGKGRTQRIQ
jgi:hypothetical protein